MLTQKQIAEKLGVSQQAVSFALNGGGTLKQATRDYIIEEAQKLGYRSNAASKLFREGRMNAIALIVHGNFHILPGLMLSRLRPMLRERDMHLMLFGAEISDFADPTNPPRLVREMFVDGFLVMYDDQKHGELSRMIENFRIPSVWINRKRSYYCVYPDETAISEQLVTTLADRYAGDFLYFSPKQEEGSHYSVGDREQGFLKGLEKTGRKGELVEVPNDGWQLYFETVGSAFHRRPRHPRIVITYGREDAQAFYMEALKAGLKVPADVRIYCFTTQRAQLGHRPIGHVLVPLGQCGVTAFEMLEKRLKWPEKRFRSKAVDEFVLNDYPEHT
jgi:DNA-binding LacI/PurR family transcriptional regulator